MNVRPGIYHLQTKLDASYVQYLMGPVHLLVVEVAHVRVEPPLAGDVLVVEAADVPLADHVRFVPGLLHVLREDLKCWGEEERRRRKTVCNHV